MAIVASTRPPVNVLGVCRQLLPLVLMSPLLSFFGGETAANVNALNTIRYAGSSNRGDASSPKVGSGEDPQEQRVQSDRVLGVDYYYDTGYYWPGEDGTSSGSVGGGNDGRIDDTLPPTSAAEFPMPSTIPSAEPSFEPSTSSSPVLDNSNSGRVPPTIFRPPSGPTFIDGADDISIGGGGNGIDNAPSGQTLSPPTSFPTIEGEIDVQSPNHGSLIMGPSMTAPNLPPAVMEPGPTTSGGDFPSSQFDQAGSSGSVPTSFPQPAMAMPSMANSPTVDGAKPGSVDGAKPESVDGSNNFPPNVAPSADASNQNTTSGSPGSETSTDSNSTSTGLEELEDSLTADFCQGMVASKATVVSWTYSVEFIPNATSLEKEDALLDVETKLASRVLTCPETGTDIATGRGGRILQESGVIQGLVGVDPKPYDILDNTAVCASNDTSIRNVTDCSIYDGVMTAFLGRDADDQGVRSEMLMRISDVMKSDDFPGIPSIVRVTYLEPSLSDDVVSEANDGSLSPSTIPAPTQNQSFVVAFTTVGLFIFIAISLVVYRRRQKQEGDGALAVDAVSGMTTEISGTQQRTEDEDSQPTSPFSSMLPGCYTMNGQDAMSAILEGDSSDSESRTQSSVLLSDGGYTTDGDSVQDETYNTSRHADPVLGVQKVDDDDFMATERAFLFESDPPTDEEISKMSPMSTGDV